MKSDFVFVSESVSKGHPDKLCDQISDAIVDSFLEQDAAARVDAECAVSTGVVFIATHFHSTGSVDVTDSARRVIADAGYVEGEFNAENCTILTSIRELPNARAPSPSLVTMPAEQQGTLFGYACRDTQALMPLPITLAHALARSFDAARERGDLGRLSPDGKTQVAVRYEDQRPKRIHSISIVVGHDAGRFRNDLHDRLREAVIAPVFADAELAPDGDTRVLIQTEATLAAGGPSFHSGLTGRKTAVDTYGEFARHSGSALSGKDPLRIDRMGAYAARYAAKNVVAAELADRCEVQLSYSIGEAEPVSLNVDTFATGALSDSELTERVAACFDFRLGAILEQFGIRERFAARGGGFFLPFATYGHMGRTDLAPPWEVLDRVDPLRRGAA